MSSSTDAYTEFPNGDFTPGQLCLKSMRTFMLIWTEICWNPEYQGTELNICVALGDEFWGDEIHF